MQSNNISTVYIIRNKRGGYYIGYTSDICRRIKRHNRGWTKSTKNKGEWELVYFENFKSKGKIHQKNKKAENL